MQYPLISEYLAAIRDAHDNLDKLSHLVPVFAKYCIPIRCTYKGRKMILVVS